VARNPASIAFDLALAPARLAFRVGRGLIAGGPADRPAPAEPPQPPPPPPRPKDLDDVTIARKVESVVFRDRKVAKGKVDVNVADGVVWLRGEVKTPDLVKQLEAQARAIPEVRGVENLLHLPKTPAPSRTDTPPSQRKTRRSKPRPGARKVTAPDVSDEAPAPPGAEPSPRRAAATGSGRRPAPMGSQGDEPPAGPDAPEGPDTAELDRDPAYNPTQPGLRDLKGG
jgi:BON domain